MALFSLNSYTPHKLYYCYRGGFAFSFALLTTIFSIYHIDMVGLNPFQLVLVGTILEITCFLFEVPTGIVADHYSRKLSLVLGLIIMGVGIFIEGYFPMFFTVALAQVIWGVGGTFLSGADIAWISDEVKQQNIDHILLKGTQIGQVCTLAGIFFSIWLATWQVNWPVMMSGLLFILLGVVMSLFMEERNFRPTANREMKPFASMVQTFRGGLNQILRSRILVLIFLALLLVGFFSEGWDRLWTFRFLKDLEFPSLLKMDPLYWFALINAVAILVNFAVIEVMKKRIDGSNPAFLVGLLMFSHLLMSCSVFLFAMTGNFYLAIASYWTTHTFRNTNVPLNEIIINRQITNSNIRATVFSMKGQVDQLGQIVGGPLVGFCALQFSVSIALGIAAVIILAGSGIYMYMVRRRMWIMESEQ